MLTPRTFVDPTRQPKPKKARKGIRRVSKKRAKQNRVYASLRPQYILDNPICEVWLKENGWCRVKPLWYERGDGSGRGTLVDAQLLIGTYDAPQATEIHHAGKRRGEKLNDQSDWFAVCRANHERIENNKAWARREGFLRNF